MGSWRRVAGQDGGQFMADLSPSPAFEAAVKAQGGHGERVEKASELPAALARARDVVVKEKRQAASECHLPTVDSQEGGKKRGSGMAAHRMRDTR